MPALSRLLAVPVTATIVLTGLALPASASTTANEVVYTKTTEAGASVVLRDLLTRRETVVLPTTSTFDYDTPELSPSGDKVVAAYDQITSTTEIAGIVVVSRTGTGRTNLTTRNVDTTSSFDLEPTFSPDGQTVLFTRVAFTDPEDPATYSFTLMTVPAAGGTATALPGGTGGFAGSYDPTDGSRVVFTKITDVETFTGPISTVKEGVVTTFEVSGRYPKYSPDGSEIAFTKEAVPASGTTFGRDDVAITSSTGASTRTLQGPYPEGFASVVAWLPDGQSLVYDLESENGFELWGVDPDGNRHGVVVPATATSDASGVHVQGPKPADVTAAGGASTYVPVDPVRLLDSRGTTGGHQGTFAPGEAFALTVTPTVPSNATAAVFNVTVTGGTAPTVVQVYPAPVSPLPATSSLNTIAANQTRANQVTVTLPASDGPNAGKVALRNGAGNAHLIVDLAGYYVAGAGSAAFKPLSPVRVLNATSLGQGGTLDLDVLGRLDVADDATAVVLNVTATGATTATNVKAYPKPASGNAVPLISSLNVVPGEDAPNLVTVKIGDLGKVRLQNAVGSVKVIADLVGYYGGTSASSVYTPISPARFLDTRAGLGAAPILATGGGFVDVRFEGYRGLPASVDAVLLNLTGTSVEKPTYVTAYPSGIQQPNASNLNLVKGDSRANAAVSSVGDNGRVRLRNNAGTTHLIADLAGYFTTPVVS